MMVSPPVDILEVALSRLFMARAGVMDAYRRDAIDLDIARIRLMQAQMDLESVSKVQDSLLQISLKCA